MYFVKTPYDLKMAQKMFYEWQKDHIQKEDQWESNSYKKFIEN